MEQHETRCTSRLAAGVDSVCASFVLARWLAAPTRRALEWSEVWRVVWKFLEEWKGVGRVGPTCRGTDGRRAVGSLSCVAFSGGLVVGRQ